MSYFIFAPILGAAANLLVACFVFLRAPGQRLNQIYFIWGISLVLWCTGASALFFVQDHAAAVRWAHVLHLGVIWIPVTGLHVCLLMARTPARHFVLGCYGVTIALTVGLFFGLHISGVQRVSYGWFAQAGPGFWFFSFFMPCATLPAVYALIRRRHMVDSDQKRKFTILVAANSLLLITGTHDLAPVLGWFRYPGTGIVVYPWGTYAAGFYGLLVAYGVLQDQILDVRVTLSRYAAFVVRLGFFFSLALLLLIVAAAVGPEDAFTAYSFMAALVVLFGASIVTGALFPKVFGGIGEGLERRLLGDRFEYYEQIRALADSVHRHTTLDAMWTDVGAVVHEAMNVTPVHCLLLGARKFAVSFRGTLPLGDGSAQVLGNLTAECALLSYFAMGHQVLDAARSRPFGRHAFEIKARAEALRLGAEYVFALRGAERVLGFIAVGRKKNATPYSSIDIELLERLAQRLAWATERTLLATQIGFAERHELLAMMSRGLAHDLNNLLTPVSTMLQIVGVHYQRDSGEAQLLDAAQTSLRMIRKYIEETIFFAKDLQPRMTDIELSDLLADVKAVMETRAQRRGVSIECTADPGSVMADGVLCQRMLTNLLANAIDASQSGQSVWLRARVESTRGIVRFTVVDAGAGIPRHLHQHVFQPYYTTKDAGEDDERGFGLGLAVCQLIVELHQGVISLASDVGKGTTVSVELPRDGAGQPSWIPPHYVY